MSRILKYGDVRLIGLPHAKAAADDVFVDDCYRLDTFPKQAYVVDIGAFYGEFAIACAARGHDVVAYEPSDENMSALLENVALWGKGRIQAFPFAVWLHAGEMRFEYNPDHPADSQLDQEGADTVTTISIGAVMTRASMQSEGRPIVVKLDCEGAETVLFKDTAWLEKVTLLTMEWHNCDGLKYAEILQSAGFEVEIEGSGPKPRPAWELGMSSGLLHARRK